MNKEITRRIWDIIANAPFNKLMEFVNAYCKDEKPESIKVGMEATFVDWLTYWVLNAPIETKKVFLELDEFDEHPLRICSVCGKFMHEGYITGAYDYYCSDECRLDDYKKLCDGSDEEANKLIEQDFCEDSDDFYYTEW